MKQFFFNHVSRLRDLNLYSAGDIFVFNGSHLYLTVDIFIFDYSHLYSTVDIFIQQNVIYRTS